VNIKCSFIFQKLLVYPITLKIHNHFKNPFPNHTHTLSWILWVTKIIHSKTRDLWEKNRTKQCV